MDASHRDAVCRAGFDQHLRVRAHTSTGDLLATTLDASHRDAVCRADLNQHLRVRAHTSTGDLLAMSIMSTQLVVLKPAGDVAIPVEPSNHATVRDPDGGSDVEHTDDEDDAEPAEHELVEDASNNFAGDGIGQARPVPSSRPQRGSRAARD